MNRNLPSIRHLKYLAALAKYKSFSRAAEACHVTQSTLSSGIKELESLLQHPVAIRTSRSVMLTSFGAEVLKQGQKVLAEASYIMHLSKVASEPMSGTMRIGIIPTIAPYWLPEILQKIQKAYPSLDLQLEENLTRILLENIQNSTLDLAIIAFPYQISGLEKKIFFRDYFSLIRKKSAEPLKKALPLDRVDFETLLVLEDGHCLRDHVMAACKMVPKSGQEAGRYRLSSLLTLMQLVSQGLGEALIPEIVLKNAPMPEHIESVELVKPKPFREIGAVWRGDNPLAPDIQKLVETLS